MSSRMTRRSYRPRCPPERAAVAGGFAVRLGSGAGAFAGFTSRSLANGCLPTGFFEKSGIEARSRFFMRTLLYETSGRWCHTQLAASAVEMEIDVTLRRE